MPLLSSRKTRARIDASLRHLLLCAVVALAGCSTMLPTIVPDMADTRPVRLEGANGPLSAQQSKAILDRLKSRGGDTNIFDLHLAIEEGVTGSPLVVGNKVTLLQDGPATYQSMFTTIRAARQTIHMESYIFEDDDVGKRFADLLLEKQRQGVQVALIYDSVGSFGAPTEFFARLADNGIRTLEFNPVNPLTARTGWQVNQRDHRKLLIVDGLVAYVGGINISGVYSTGSFSRGSKPGADGKSLPWRDTQVQIEGPVVAEFQKLFLATWAKQKGDPLRAVNFFPPQSSKGKEVVRAIGSSPDEPFSVIYATLISAIRSAETSIYLTNAYFVPDPQLRDALKAAARRGVDVKLILPSSTDFDLVLHAGRSYYGELLAAGVKIHERRNALLHSKTALIDGVWSTIGSTNLDWRSFLHNDEVNAVILGTAFGTQMRQMFDADLAASDPVSLEQWQRRPLLDRAKEITARAWKYFL